MDGTTQDTAMHEPGPIENATPEADLLGRLKAAEAEVEKLREENHELRSTPWPAWADTILGKLRSYGLDPDDEVHLADEFDGFMDEFEAEIRRQCLRTAMPLPGSSFELNPEETEDLERAMALVSETLRRKGLHGKTDPLKPDLDGERAWGLRIARLRGRLAAFDDRARGKVGPTDAMATRQ